MADVPNRDALERALARQLGGLNRRQLGHLIELLGDPPNIANVPFSFWEEAGKELAEVVVPFSERVYLDAAERMLADIPIGVDWNLVNEGASNWARQYGFDLVSGINNTSRQAVSSAVSNYFERGWDMRQLTGRLGRIYSPVRAEMIAVTEVTRAASEGEQGIVREIAREGIQMVPIWQTNNDELVCPICWPKHDKEIKDGVYPPAHPRCRCWVNHEFPEMEVGQTTLFSHGRMATAAETEATSDLFVFGEGQAMTAAQTRKAQQAIDELSQLRPFRNVNEVIYMTGDTDFIAYSMGEGRIIITDAFLDDDMLRYYDKWYGGRKGILSHELGHELQDLMTASERKKYIDIHMSGREWWKKNSSKLIGNDYANYDNIFLKYNPSYQAQNGWIEDLAESYRIYLGSGGESGPLGDRAGIIANILGRIL